VTTLLIVGFLVAMWLSTLNQTFAVIMVGVICGLTCYTIGKDGAH